LQDAPAVKAGKQPVEAAGRQLVLPGQRGNGKALDDDLEAEESRIFARY
jgi:hypothetical protein